MTLVDPNELALERAQGLFKKFNQEFRSIHKSLFDLSTSETDFDIVICEGVLHHTYDPLVGLEKVCSLLRPGCLLIVAMDETSGCYKRELQRLAVRSGNPSEKEIVDRSRLYFSEHLDRAIKFGLRDEKTVIYDTFVNPQIKTSSVESILETFKTNNVEHHSSFPSLRNPFDLRPVNIARADYFDYESHRDWFDFLKKCWIVSGGDSETSVFEKIMGITHDKISWIESEINMLEKLRSNILANNFDIKDLKPIQKGYLGLGMNYFVGIKK